MNTFNSPQPDRDQNQDRADIEREEIRQRFKRALKAGEQPRVSEFVDAIEQDKRSALIRELLEIEADFQRLEMETLDIVPPLQLRAKNESTRGVEATLNQTSQADTTNRNEEPPPPYVGRYEVGRPIGRGGFGSVYLGWDPQLEREVAIKIPRFRETDPDRRQKRIDAFLAEARAAVQLERHAGIIPVYDAGIQDGVCYIVSQFAPGGSLSDSGAQLNMSLAEKIRFTATLADTIAFAHEHGWIHRDIKPSNILIDDLARPYLTDFGLTLKAADMAAVGGAMEGTPKYMSPEQAQAAHAAMQGRSSDVTVDHQSDIYSLGVVFYELLTDQLPHNGDSVTELFEKLIREPATPPGKLTASIPAGVSRVCMRALEKNPKQRFQSAHEFRDQLHAQANAIESTLNTTPIEHQPNSQIFSVALIGGVLAALVVGFVVWMLVQSRDNYIAPSDLPPDSQVVLLDAESDDKETIQHSELKKSPRSKNEREPLAFKNEDATSTGADSGNPPVALNNPNFKQMAGPRTRMADKGIDPNGSVFGQPLSAAADIDRQDGFSIKSAQPMEHDPLNSEPADFKLLAKHLEALQAKLVVTLENPQSTPAEIESAARRLREIAGDDAPSLKLIERAIERLEFEEPPEVE